MSQTATIKFESGIEVERYNVTKNDNYPFWCQSPVVIVGTPRSGTSTVARIMHEYFGICMGTAWYNQVESNPAGNFEDKDLVDTNQDFIEDRITLSQWEFRLMKFFHKMEKLGGPWGFKDPRMIRLVGAVLPYFKKCTIIRTYRPAELCVPSRVKYLGWSHKSSSVSYVMDMATLDRLLSHYEHIKIDFTEQLNDIDIIKSISKQSRKIYDSQTR